jgi:hypothetical protein
LFFSFLFLIFFKIKNVCFLKPKSRQIFSNHLGVVALHFKLAVALYDWCTNQGGKILAQGLR